MINRINEGLIKIDNLIGRSIDRYHIIEQLGQGGMATVYRALDTHLECSVAVKVIRHDAFSKDLLDQVLKRFEREAKTLAMLTHPNIVNILDYGEFEGSPYLVMPFIPSATLKERMGNPIPYSQAARMLAPIARALDYAHGKGVLHRDVKPSNILITESDEPVLTDFGIAKMLEMEAGQTLTGTGMGIGTPEYMSPEQGLGKAVDKRTDIYALGVVFYELITGRKPYTADTPMAVIFKHISDPLPRPRDFIPDLPQEVEHIIVKAMAKKPEDRYENMAGFARALEKVTQFVPVAVQEFETRLDAIVKPVMPEPLAETQNNLKLQEPNPSKQAKKFRIPKWLVGVGGGLLALLLILWLVVGMIIPGIERSQAQSATSMALTELAAQIVTSDAEQTAQAQLLITDKTATASARTESPIVTLKPNLTEISPATVAPVPATGKLKICQVTDTSGIDDKSFNATAWLGMQNAEKDFGVEISYLESQQQSDYEVNINTFIDANCDLIVPVGFLLADATSAAADTNPDQKFAIVDVDYLTQTNVLGDVTKIDQATFLAGYLAAGMTKTGKVGTYVGILFPATQAFMDGYAMGVAKYNEVHGTNVEVLGWNMETQEGLQVGNFESLDDGRAFGEQLLKEGADIIMPVAGPVGLGTLAVMQELGTGLLIGVDNDWSITNPDKADFVVASALKKIDAFVYESIKLVVNGTFQGGSPYLLTLENKGVGLQYGTKWEDQIPEDLKAEIEGLIPGIVSGAIATLPVR